MEVAFSHFLTQMLSTVGVIFLFGLVIALLSRLFYANMGYHARRAAVITGFLGTPVHECAHALFCILFLHKITDIRLFTPYAENGCFGYVSHSWNRRDFYQRIGNFFIGIAPILVISGVLFLLARWLVPEMIADVLSEIEALDVTEGAGEILAAFWGVICAFFSAAGSFRWWIFLLFSFSLVLHMNLSPADIKGAWFGLVLLMILIFAVDIALSLISTRALNAFTSAFTVAGGFMLGFFSLALLISVLTALFSLIFRLFQR